MSGTKAGSKKAVATIKKKYGADFYKKTGKKGGQNGHTGGFYGNPELARIAGAKGGKKSRRTGVKNGQHKTSKPKKVTIKAKKTTPEPVEVVRVFKERKVIETPKKKGLLSKIFGRNDG